MPHEAMNVEQVAKYLKLTVKEVVKLASRGRLPARKVSGKFQFRKGQVDHWVEEQMPELSRRRLAQIERGVTAHHGLDHEATIVTDMVPPGGIVAALPAKTRDSAIRLLVAAAEGDELVYDASDLVAKIREREELCSTAVHPGVALPHPRQPLPYDIASSFVIVGRTSSGIPYGSPDGGLTRLFLLICCKDDRTHLHVLARVSRMLDQTTIDRLMEAPEADDMREILLRRELVVVAEQ